eukprot:NODE_14986_length_1074_cov_7.237592.p1 GENE.NODE_14986_length_1074_cov_7.237592~~NODE_14986_length_1074_cov_7.237592.p1  ORF type:complete len:247 (-),score=50.92 NODE_14986_length_1074_cov_7.237592:252-992(-)
MGLAQARHDHGDVHESWPLHTTAFEADGTDADRLPAAEMLQQASPCAPIAECCHGCRLQHDLFHEEQHRPARSVSDLFTALAPPPTAMIRHARAWELCMLGAVPGRPVLCITPCPTVRAKRIRRVGKKPSRLYVNDILTQLIFSCDVPGHEMHVVIWLTSIESIGLVYISMGIYKDLASALTEFESDNALLICYIDDDKHHYVCFIENGERSRDELLEALLDLWRSESGNRKSLTNGPHVPNRVLP